MSGVLAIDLGTTTLKVAVIDPDGEICGRAEAQMPTIRVGDDGYEQDPELWWEMLGRCARQAVANGKLPGRLISKVAITSQYSSPLPIDQRGRPLGNAVMWMDRRGARHRRPVGPERPWKEVHGLRPSVGDDIGRLDVIRACRPDAWAEAYAFVQPMDYLAARLTGVVAATQSSMFSMLACDNRWWGATSYSPELLAWTGVEESRLPRLVGLNEPRGGLTREAVTHLGISAGALVCGATIDSVTSAVGTGAVSADRCGLIIGTTAVLATHISAKRFDDAAGLTSAPSPVDHSWFIVAENGIGGKALDVVTNQLLLPDDGAASGPVDAYATAIELAGQVPPGAEGVVFLPWLVGSMAPSWDRAQRGGFLNVGVGTTRAQLVRAVLEGVAANVAWLYPAFARLAERTYTEVAFGGGGAKSALWAQVLADTLGVTVRRLKTTGLTNARGAALLALVMTGEITVEDIPAMLITAELHRPDPAAHAVLGGRAAQLAELHAALAPFYASINNQPGSTRVGLGWTP